MKTQKRSVVVALSLLFACTWVAPAASLRDGLVSYWPLDENTSSTTADAAFTNTMIVTGTPTVSAGQYSNAFTFNGSSVRLANTHAADPTVSGLPIYKAGNGSYT